MHMTTTGGLATLAVLEGFAVAIPYEGRQL